MSSIWHYPKKKLTRYQERDPQARVAFQQELATLDPASLVWVDECGLEHTPYRQYARAPRGQHIYEDVPGKRTQRISVLAAYHQHCLVAPMRLTGYTNTTVFNTWLKKCLLPQLKPGQVVILDNASFHQSDTTRQLIEAHGCRLLFLPAYSPDLNKIEAQWANLKDAIRLQQDPTISFLEKLDTQLVAMSNRKIS